ncbi:MAG TPA: orotidine-5'-phosphate decarboxylase [Symbiobacteriaceae bacterium]|nr:orotidine-5'-phosphate decarboxylase [Symbiobacteriaceae bacterium]
MRFADRVIGAVRAKQSHAVVGLDPVMAKLPPFLLEEADWLHGRTPAGAAHALQRFSRLVIDAVAGRVAVVKPQSAFYEIFGAAGLAAFWDAVSYAQSKGLLVIADAKRGDIGTTAAAYADAFFGGGGEWQTGVPAADSLTINPYLGTDGLKPFLRDGRGVFVLVKTSNPSSGEFQDQSLGGEGSLAGAVARLVDELGQGSIGESGYSDVGAVVGATYPVEAERYRQLMPRALFLVPGYGAQGGTAADVVPCFNPDGLGALVSASRSVIYAFASAGATDEVGFKLATAEAADRMNEDLNGALRAAGKLAWA